MVGRSATSLKFIKFGRLTSESHMQLINWTRALLSFFQIFIYEVESKNFDFHKLKSLQPNVVDAKI